VFILAASSRCTIAEQPLPTEVTSAKSIYLVNQTGDDKVLAAAVDQFTSWGRFAISQSATDADISSITEGSANVIDKGTDIKDIGSDGLRK
jgi:hypothetical protein